MAKSIFQVERWRPGQRRIRTDDHNVLIQAVQDLCKGRQLVGLNSVGNLMTKPDEGITQWLGVTGTDTGLPDGSEFADNRYYVRPVYGNNTEDDPADDVVEIAEYASGENQYRLAVVTNLAESEDGSHSLPLGTPVHVFTIRDRYGTSILQRHYMIERPGATALLFAVLYSWELFTSGTPRWQYGWKQSQLAADCTAPELVGGLEGGPNTTDEDDYAINLVECNNVPIGGVQGHSLIDGDSTYWTMETLPIGRGALVDGQTYGLVDRAVPVELRTRIDAGGYPRKTFSMVNGVDVTCIVV